MPVKIKKVIITTLGWKLTTYQKGSLIWTEYETPQAKKVA